MVLLINIAVGLALAAVLGVLIAGVLGLAQNGEFNRRYGNLLMRWRVGLQFLAIVLLALAFYVNKG